MRHTSRGIEKLHSLPSHGEQWIDIDRRLGELEKSDARWRENRVFGIYFPVSRQLDEVIAKAHERFFRLSTHHPEVFPSMSELEREIVGMCATLFGADTAVGNVTAGGTESILVAARAARDMARLERNVSMPEMIVPQTAYPAFAKAGAYLGIRVVRVAINDEHVVDLRELERAITKNTVFMAGSVPSITHGAIDPIPEMAALAQDIGAWFHVDASLGGFQLPFLGKLGVEIPPFDLRVPGVTSLSADIHKYAYSSMGASVILHKREETYQYQQFSLDDWVGTTYRSPGTLGSRSGGPIAAAWAAMRYLGENGYVEATRRLRHTCQRLIDGINSIPAFRILGDPITATIVYTSDVVCMKDVCALMEARGWVGRPQLDPPSVRLLVAPEHEEIVTPYLQDLEVVAAQLLAEKASNRVRETSAAG